jgi:hypothetical protein
MSAASEATMVKKLNFNQIIDRADVILSGRVISVVHSTVEENGRQVPYTFVTVTVNDVVKGKVNNNSYTFKLLGGPVPGKNIALGVSSMPVFCVDQEVFLFLKDNEALHSPIVGFFQGRFNIQTDRNTGAKHLYDNSGRLVTEKELYGETARSPGSPVNYEMFINYVRSKVTN